MVGAARHLTTLLVPLLLLLLSSSSMTTATPTPAANRLQERNSTSSTACNNSPDLCSKTYGDIVHLGAHDSPFLRDSSTDYSTSGNQYFNTTVQLSAGVRLVTAQVYNEDGELHLCHSSCDLLDAGTLEDWLSEIKTWMDANTNDVVTILLVNSDDLSADDLATPFESTGISSYGYSPNATSTPISASSWPTLSTMIAANTRLVTFVASLSSTSSSAPYLLDEFTYVFENNYDVTALDDFTCEAQRPTDLAGETTSAISSGYLALMNHFLDEEEAFGIEIPDVGNITTTNSPNTNTTGALGTSANNCTDYYGGQHPTFILVDFFDEGPALETIDRLNDVTDSITGRTAAPSPTEDQIDGSSSASSAAQSVRGCNRFGGNAVLALVGLMLYIAVML